MGTGAGLCRAIQSVLVDVTSKEFKASDTPRPTDLLFKPYIELQNVPVPRTVSDGLLRREKSWHFVNIVVLGVDKISDLGYIKRDRQPSKSQIPTTIEI